MEKSELHLQRARKNAGKKSKLRQPEMLVSVIGFDSPGMIFRTCQFFPGEIYEGKCGKPAKRGSPYCQEHYEICYKPIE